MEIKGFFCDEKIRLLCKLEELDTSFCERERPLAQKYLLHPLLLLSSKFTFRIYVLLTSCNPFRFYIFPEGLVRIASKKYSPLDFSDLLVHLDSIDLNQSNVHQFMSRKEEEGEEKLESEGLRCKVSWVLQHLKEREGLNVSRVWQQIETVVCLSLLANEPNFSHFSSSYLPSPSSSFLYLGYDIVCSSFLFSTFLFFSHTPC